uniref:NOF-FB transposable element protein n=1 Tax=Sipha flava TaxID=143950 RepID=A0A2S2R3G3_9HEMI
MVKIQTLDDLHTLLLSLFVVLINETNGKDQEDNETPCEKHYKILMTATTTGFVEFENKFNSIIAYAESKNDAHAIMEEEFERQNEGLSKENPFISWAEKVYEKSKSLIQEGSGINPMYLPTLIPHLIKCMKLLPLWSGIMVPIFGFGEKTSSSAAVESSFHKLKNGTLNHINLPMNIESFLEHHILSLRGSSLLKGGQNKIFSSENSLNVDTPIKIVQENQCRLCSEGTSPCFNCLNVDNFNIYENNAQDKWNRKPKKQLKSNSYLLPNPHLRLLNMKALKNIKTLPLLKNGSRAEELKSIKLKNIDGAIILSNTCAFDAVSSLILVVFCDSDDFSTALLEKNSKFIEFISKTIRNGISSNTYI